ncbi:ATP-binding protein [Bacillus sp. S/N-304-OC-R1]|uniref:ATP-binding protein n=1 Tax=Bacillus sp. S/N-304-OC-R1 TaxID=2758034 RepID=UPI001C8DCCBE|nr:ATP-binding protein [Bacillus sp. S/N-304-OC-R1]MBY0121183.1 ATP-binding protein [Bacillus sp. S/N-304-OC-R1]
MRDVLIIPFNGKESIVVACDNSGGIGLKELDAVQVPYDTVAYYSFRVAVMECLAAGGNPFAVTLQNFCGEASWNELLLGINRGVAELGLKYLQITGSTESNFPLVQSAVGLTVLGKKKTSHKDLLPHFTDGTRIAVIGKPLVGDEVIENETEVVPLSIFKLLCVLEDAILLPVGSKGIFHELNGLFSNRTFIDTEIISDLDIYKSSGPSTCVLAVSNKKKMRDIMRVAGSYYYEIDVIEC